MTVGLFDTHCHLDFEAFDTDREEVVQRALDAGVCKFLIPGTQRVSERFRLPATPGVECAYGVGLHPYFIAQHTAEDLAWVATELAHDPRLWVGEIGLDAHCPAWPLQEQLFVQQVQLAVDYQRPLIVHHRDTQQQLLELLQPFTPLLPEQAGILHAFSGSYEQAREWVKRGFKIGVGGVITYPRAKKTRRAIAQLPLSSLVLETDAPAMPVCGHQGQRNEPARLTQIVNALAELRTEPEEELRTTLWQTSCALIASV
ncbi:TatD family hydrolase [Pseudidiomarina sediminum]|uniref:TatD family hydrolase n=1 Tax=Pseudidiomarina sediminum TaxID=431675 RepID=UPI001C970D8C|nr:TatD family hydrolase [Pseudidiomarina sediminum]MBY6065088.1 TatD family hydrolase [Pseudidiomarina sediminum]